MRAVILFSVVVACGCSSKPGEAGSCRNESNNSCVEYSATQGAAGKRMCPASQWTSGEKSCSVANRLGSCASKDGARWLYSGAPNNYSAASAKAACEFSGGVFTP